jgi:hypothetical protein
MPVFCLPEFATSSSQISIWYEKIRRRKTLVMRLKVVFFTISNDSTLLPAVGQMIESP